VEQVQEADLQQEMHQAVLRLLKRQVPRTMLSPEIRPKNRAEHHDSGQKVEISPSEDQMKYEPIYCYSEQRKPWEYWQKKQEEALREALGGELFDYLESMTQNERNTVRDRNYPLGPEGAHFLWMLRV
jgi:hypothetical protein